MKNIIVVGAGASGLMAAMTAAKSGASVTVLERGQKPGRKLLRTGNGHCNLSNLGSPDGKYSSSFGEQVLKEWPVRETLRLFRSIGVAVRERDGWVYPYNEEAQTVLRALLRGCEECGVRIRTNTGVQEIDFEDGHFHVRTDGGWSYEADAVILSCGSPAGLSDGGGFLLPQSGSSVLSQDGELLQSRDGESLLSQIRRLGHTVIPMQPGLVGLRTGRRELAKCAGTRARVRATLFEDGKAVDSERGQIQFGAKGISGICIMNLSTRAVKELSLGKRVEIGLNFLTPDLFSETDSVSGDFVPDSCDFVPDLYSDWNSVSGGTDSASHKINSVSREINSYSRELNSEFLRDALSSILPEKLLPVVMNGIDISEKAYGPESDAVLSRLTDFRLPVTGPLSMKDAQVASGGIRTDEIDPRTMESKLVPGLYITGEVLDVTGKCGGWNLQFAWSTGVLAGRAAAEP